MKNGVNCAEVRREPECVRVRSGACDDLEGPEETLGELAGRPSRADMFRLDERQIADGVVRSG